MTFEETRSLYNQINAHLSSLAEGASILHLNYGYAGIAGVPRRSVVSMHVSDPSVDLILEVIGGCSLGGRDILDVGCGRGGTVRTLCECFPVANSMTGVDCSSAAIAFCRS